MASVLIGIPCLNLGGTEMQTLNLVRVLVAAAYRVTVACYYEYAPAVAEQYRQAGAEVILLGLQRSEGACTLIKRLKTLIRDVRPDIVHIQYMAPGLLPIVAARLAGVRCLLATVHQPGRTAGFKAKWFLRMGAALCTSFFCVSRSAESSWFGDSRLYAPDVPRGRRRHYTIYNAVDTARVDELAGRASVTNSSETRRNQGRSIGIVARLRKEKGHNVLLDAMPLVVDRFPDVTLLVVGDGPDRESLHRQAETLGVGSHVRWVGAVSQDEALGLYGAMDVVVVPSLFEGFGLSAAEAMAAGRPVVASAVDGLAEVVEDGQTGILVPPSDSKALAAALVRLLSDPVRAGRMGEAGRARVKRCFSLERFTTVTLAAYQAALSDKA